MSHPSQPQQQQAQQPQDPMIKFRAVKRGKNSKGGDRIELYIGGSPEIGNQDVEFFIQVLQAYVANPRGIKLDLHVTERQTPDGRKFDSAIIFVKPTAEKTSGGYNQARPQMAPAPQAHPPQGFAPSLAAASAVQFRNAPLAQQQPIANVMQQFKARVKPPIQQSNFPTQAPVYQPEQEENNFVADPTITF